VSRAGRGAIGETVGRLLFAGESCALEAQGSMEGGCGCGELAAAAVKQARGIAKNTALFRIHGRRIAGADRCFLYWSVSFCSAACKPNNDSFTIAPHPDVGEGAGPQPVRPGRAFYFPMPSWS
jgi:hypothetical protein